MPLLRWWCRRSQAAAILLPILLVQDAISVWVYHRDFSLWNLQALIPGAFAGAVLASWWRPRCRPKPSGSRSG